MFYTLYADAYGFSVLHRSQALVVVQVHLPGDSEVVMSIKWLKYKRAAQMGDVCEDESIAPRLLDSVLCFMLLV